MDISKIDKNFSNSFDSDGMRTYDINRPPFSLHGLCREAGEEDFKRLPHSLPGKIGNEAIQALYRNTSGIRLRFRTDSLRVILKCRLSGIGSIPHMPFTGSACFDLYADGTYCNVFRPGIDIHGHYSDNTVENGVYASGYTFKSKQMREILIHFPLYTNVEQVVIALEETARVLAPTEYAVEAPVVFYGSSITQGACASHPGNCYAAMLSRKHSFDYINLGFSSGCLAEEEMADYLSSLRKSVLVYDYDHNASSVEYLRETHEKFFLKLREKESDLPVIMISASDHAFGPEKREIRKNIIQKTYENARLRGDENAYFVDGTQVYGARFASLATVDNTHPNDLGFYLMAEKISAVLDKILI